MVDAKWDAMTCVQVKRRANIVEVRLNRPEKMNAINSTMEKEFYAVLADCDRMDDVKCVVLTAEGPNFSSGHDVQQVAVRSLVVRNRRRFKTSIGSTPVIFFRHGDSSKGLVVAAKGYVGPHANTFVLAADVVIAAANTRFSWEESRVGVGCAVRMLCPDAISFSHPSHEAVVDDRVDGWMRTPLCNCSMSTVLFRWVRKKRWRCASPCNSVEWQQAISSANKRGTHRMYEAAGLSAMVDVGRDPYVPTVKPPQQRNIIFELIYEKGVRAAMRERDSGWDDEVSKV